MDRDTDVQACSGQKKKIALILSGGSARGAYEIGVIKAILPEFQKRGGFKFICGTSVGSINACLLTSLLHEPVEKILEGLEHYWLTLKKEHVFSENWANVGLRSFMGSLKLGEADFQGLLDNSPLKRILETEIDWSQLRKNLDNELIQALTVTATSVTNGRSVVFYESNDPNAISVIPRDSINRYVPTKIELSHTLASSSIPIFFKPEYLEFKDHDIDNGDWFFDGGVRQNTPLAPALVLGADALVVVGLHFMEEGFSGKTQKPGLVQSIGKLLNALFLDHIRHDIHRLSMVNELLGAMDDDAVLEKINLDRVRRGHKPWRIIPHLFITPSKPISEVAEEVWDRYPDTRKSFRTIDLLFRVGNLQGHLRGDLLSYFFFNPYYSKALIELGYQDGLEMINSTVYDPILKKEVKYIDWICGEV